MDSIEVLKILDKSYTHGSLAFDFSPSDISGDCEKQIRKLVKQRISSKNNVDKGTLQSALLCLNDGNGLCHLGNISVILGYWNCSIKSYEKALLIFEKLGQIKNVAKTYINLGSVYAKMGEWNKAIGLYQKSLEIFEKLSDELGKAKIYNDFGLIYFGMSEWNKAVEFYEKSLEISIKIGETHTSAATYCNLGSVYALMGDWNKTIDFYQKSLEIFKKRNDVYGVSKNYNNLGSVYYRMGDWNKAIEFFQKSLEIKEKLGDVQGIAESYNNLGWVFSGMGEENKAIELSLKSVELFEKLGDLHGAGEAYHHLGLVYEKMDDWNKAIEFCQKSKKIFEKLGNGHDVAGTYANLGSLYYRMEDWNKAIEFYQKSLDKFEELGAVHEVTKVYSNISLVYAALGEFNKAIKLSLKCLESFEKLGDLHGKGETLSNIGKFYLEMDESSKAKEYLEESIKLLNSESRPEYPNALNWLASCYHRIGIIKKAQAKREKDHKRKEKLVNSASCFFLNASELYAKTINLPRINLTSLHTYSHIDKGLAYSVKNIIEQDDKIAINTLNNALEEFKKALKLTEENDRLRIQSIIKSHEAKRYIRLAVSEKSLKNKIKYIDKVIRSLEDSITTFNELGETEQCNVKTCEGCMHLFKALSLFNEGIKEYSNLEKDKKFSNSIFELHEAQKCYEKAVNELGKDTVEILVKSFRYVEGLIKSKDEKLATSTAEEFIKIVDELSSVGLQNMVKIFVFDESMNVVNREHRNNGKPEEKKVSLPDAAALAGFFALIIGSIFIYVVYNPSNIIRDRLGFTFNNNTISDNIDVHSDIIYALLALFLFLLFLFLNRLKKS